MAPGVFEEAPVILVLDLFHQEVLRAFYKTELVKFHSAANKQSALRLRGPNSISLLSGRIIGPKIQKNNIVQELQDRIDELMEMDEMALVEIHSVRLGLGRDKTLWTQAMQRTEVDRQLISQAAAATMLRILSSSYVVTLLGSEDSKLPLRVSGDEKIDRPYRGLDWAVPTTAFLGIGLVINSLLELSYDLDRPEGLLNIASEAAVSQGEFDAVVMILGSNVDLNKRGSCKGRMNIYGNALVQVCIQSYERIVALLLQPVYNVEKKGPVYERAVSKAACGRPNENQSHIEILKDLSAKGDFANL